MRALLADRAEQETAEASGAARADDEKVCVLSGVDQRGRGLLPVYGDGRGLDTCLLTRVLVEACEKAHERGLWATSELLIGYPARQLALLAEEIDVDLIVVGSRRLNALERALLGSTSRALLTESSRRVLVVPLVAGQHVRVATPA